MLDKTWNIPAMLEDYTDHLTVSFCSADKKLVPSIIGGHMSAGNNSYALTLKYFSCYDS